MTRARDIADRNVDSTTIDGVDSTQLLRSDVADTKTAGNLSFADNVRATFGASNDLQIYHDGLNSYIKEAGTGDLIIGGSNYGTRIQDADSNDLLVANPSSVSLLHNGSEKLETTSGGIDVTGTVTADGILNNNKSEFFASESALVSTGSTAKVYATNSTFDGVNGSLVLQSRPTSGADVYIATGATPKKVAKFDDGGDISFYDSTGVTQGLYWDASTQSLGLGTTSPAGNSLTIEKSGTARLRLLESGVRAWDIETVSGSLRVNNATNSLEAMRITSAGNVGIGTTSVSEKLTVSGAGYQAISLFSGSDNIRMYANGSDLGLQSVTSGNPIIFQTNSGSGATERMRIDSSGNVGIGTTSPPTMLSLLGDAEYISIGNNSENYSGIVMYDNQSAAQSGGIHYSSTATNGNVVSIFNDLTTSYGGANRFSVDSSGRITMPDQPGFCVYMTGTYTRAGENTKIDPTWGSDHNVGSHFDTVTSVFTAPVAGRYLFSWNIAHSFSGSSNTGDAWSILPTKNGSDIFNFQGFYGDGGVESGVEGQHAGTVIVNLAANDTVYLKTSGTSATTINFLTGSNFSGYLLG